MTSARDNSTRRDKEFEFHEIRVQGHLDDGGASLVTTHGAYAAPPVRTRELRLGGAA